MGQFGFFYAMKLNYKQAQFLFCRILPEEDVDPLNPFSPRLLRLEPLHCHQEKESGFHELAVYIMIWK
jgi:hypothetical protein